MLNVLIAEDELLIRMGLESSVPWNELGFHIVAAVSDGQKAWDAYQKYHPDVIITDIRMPKLDGVELIKRIRHEDLRCKIIIITCLEDFQIFFHSMNLNITGCLLKANITQSKLYEILNQVKKELSDTAPSAAEAAVQTPADTAWFLHYLTDDGEFSGTFPRHLHANQQGYLLTVSCGPVNQVLTKSIAGVLREDLAALGSLLIAQTENLFFIYIQTQQTITLQTISSMMEHLCTYAEDIFAVSLRYVFAPAESFKKLPILAKKSMFRISQPYFFPDRAICLKGNQPCAAAFNMLEYLRNNPSCYLFFEGSVVEPLFDLIEQMKGSYGTDEAQFVLLLSRLVKQISDFCFASEKSGQLDAFQASTFDSAPAALEAFLDLVPQYSPNPLYACKMLETIRYIHKNYREPIQLTTLAEMLNVSANYYAILFRKATGFNFTDFLLSIRMYHAKKLLRETQLPIAQIAEDCGYADAAYFSRAFRKYCKSKPHQYRNAYWTSDLSFRGKE